MVSAKDDIRRSPAKQLMEKLQEATIGCHKRLESLPYFSTLIEHTLPLTCYVHQLQALAIIHGVFESEIIVAEHGPVRRIWRDSMKKLPLLLEDLAFFRPRHRAMHSHILDLAGDMSDRIRRLRLEHPPALLGYLYVLEGSTLGNSMHQPDISTTFHLPQLHGCRYYSSYRQQVHERWRDFSRAMNDTLTDEDSHAPIITAALEAFAELEKIYQALYPLRQQNGAPNASGRIRQINPEAGNHPMPGDERETAAALRASTRVWHEFPYYAHRFGERGRRFSDSDTCWLATLSQLDQESVNRQTAWLSRLLAARGMPSVMLEHALDALCEELTGVLPAARSSYEKLGTAAAGLRAARQKWIPQERCRELCEKFDRQIGTTLAEEHKKTALLLVSAVADEYNGIKGTVARLVTWMTEKNRFSDLFLTAVKKTLSDAENIADHKSPKE